MITLTELEKDALREAFNISIGRAASAMSEMMNEEVELSVPEFSFVPRTFASEQLLGQASGLVLGVIQHFSSPESKGDAFLLFHEEKSTELVRSFLKDPGLMEELTELEEEVFKEIGNIILNACLSGLSEILKCEFRISTPEFRKSRAGNILDGPTSEGEEDVVLMLLIQFSIARKEIKGYVAFVLDMDSFQSFNRGVFEFFN